MDLAAGLCAAPFLVFGMFEAAAPPQRRHRAAAQISARFALGPRPAAPADERVTGPSLWRRVLLAFLLFSVHAPAAAAVEIAFYSRELGDRNYPHAFIMLTGTVDATGEPVNASLGFTAHRVTPAILFGSVRGGVQVEVEERIAISDRQFSLTLSDERYRTVMAVVGRWRNLPQPSYNMNRANCVHFVSELALAAGLRVENRSRLMKRPRSFLQHVRALNPGLAP